MTIVTQAQTRPLITFPRLTRANFAIFLDLDETYLAHTHSEEKLLSRRNLETKLHQTCKKYHGLSAWITGSTIESVKGKVKHYDLRLIPHYIAAALGSELYYYNPETATFVADQSWQQQLKTSAYSKFDIENFMQQLQNEFDIEFQKHPDSYQAAYKIGYYFRVGQTENNQIIFDVIKQYCDENFLYLNISRCAHGIGDPEDCYDIEFLPHFCGKRAMAEFLVQRHSIDHAKTLAMGDSGNDLELLNWVKHGCLVANATLEAKARFPNISAYTHTDAIADEFAKFCNIMSHKVLV